ncbi:hypothetical protein FRB90_005754 [Tulasnella sp. 427]|nr:hypothetical protein FRB90_005754 [Tulasnella sp. 427]
MFKMVKKAVGMKQVDPLRTPPSQPASLPGSPSRAPSNQLPSTQANRLSAAESIALPPKAEDTLDLASPITPSQHRENRISLVSPFDNHEILASPVEQHAGHDEDDGSPRALGWEVDQESEEKAWEIIMKDAVEGSVFDQTPEEEETHLFPYSKEELYRTWLKHWDEVNTSLVWRVVPSLQGIHQWILQPKILGEGSVLSTGVDMSTDTDDLPCHIHANAEVQTTSKTYADVEVQTYEAEVPAGALMLLPEKPLKAPTQDFDLARTVSPPPPPAPAEPAPVERAESIRSESRSRSRSPFRRMIPSRKNSMASITSQNDTEPKPKRAQSPATETLKRLASVRTLSRKGVPSRKGTIDNASSVSVNVVADGIGARTQSGPIPTMTPAKEEPSAASTAAPARPPLQTAGTQPAAGRWGSAIRKANFAMGWR